MGTIRDETLALENKKMYEAARVTYCSSSLLLEGRCAALVRYLGLPLNSAES